MAARRGRGEGSIFEREDGLWVGVISLGIVNGKRLRKTVYGATKQDVRDKLRDLQAADPGAVPDTGKQTVGDYLHRVLAARKPSLEDNTYEFYRLMIVKHIEPVLGQVLLSKLTGQHVLGLLGEARSNKSPRMAKGIKATLQMALDYGGHWTRVTAGISRKALVIKGPKTRVRFWDEVQARRFLQSTATNELEALWLLAISTGMRQGEMLGLQWSSIDWATGNISVAHSLVEIKGKLIKLKQPKTDAGARTVKVTPDVLAALRRQKARLLQRGQAQLPMVFPSLKAKVDAVGGPGALRNYRLKNSVRRSLARLIKRAGIEAVTFHQLRHTSATLLLKAKVPGRVVQERLGHSHVAITLGLYSHVTPGMQEDAADTMAAVLRGDSAAPPVSADDAGNK